MHIVRHQYGVGGADLKNTVETANFFVSYSPFLSIHTFLCSHVPCFFAFLKIFFLRLYLSSPVLLTILPTQCSRKTNLELKTYLYNRYVEDVFFSIIWWRVTINQWVGGTPYIFDGGGGDCLIARCLCTTQFGRCVVGHRSRGLIMQLVRQRTRRNIT